MHLLRWENNRDTSPGCHEHQKKSGAGCLVWHLFLSEPTLLRLAASSLQPLGGGAGGSDKLYLIRDSHQPHPKGFSYTQNSSLSLGCGWWGWSWWSRNGKRCLRFPSATIPPPPSLIPTWNQETWATGRGVGWGILRLGRGVGLSGRCLRAEQIPDKDRHTPGTSAQRFQTRWGPWTKANGTVRSLANVLMPTAPRGRN